MRIKSVKLVKEGYEGIKVEYIEVIEKMGVEYDVYKNDKYTHPISEGLEHSLEKVKIHLLKLMRCWPSSWDYSIDYDSWKIDREVKEKENISISEIISLLEDLSVNSVTYDGDKLSFSGKMKNIDGKDIIFNTGMITPETEYNYYKDCVALINEVFVSAEDYIKKEFVKVPNKLENGIAELVAKNPKQYEGTTVTPMPFYDI